MRSLPAVRPLALSLGVASLLVALAALAQPAWLNGPEEWSWPYRAPGLELGAAIVAIAAAAGIVLLAAARGGEGTAELASRRPAATLATLVLLGVAFSLAVVSAQPGGMGRVAGSLVSRHSFGYLYDAALPATARELLAMPGDAAGERSQHTRTHPPGFLLAVRGLERAMAALPLRPWPASWEQAAAEAWSHEVGRARSRRRPTPALALAPGTVVAVALLLVAASALVAWPLHRLARRWGAGAAGALLAAGLWLLLPARSLFTPSLDQALPLGGVAAALLVAGGGPLRAAAGGAVLAACCFVSWGYLVLLPFLAGVAALRESWPWTPPDLAASGPGADTRVAPGSRGRRLAAALPWLSAAVVRGLAIATGFVVPFLLLAAATPWQPLAALRGALTEHRAIAVVSRDYATWLLGNPWDFTLLAGPLVVGLAAAAALAAVVPPATRRMSALWWALLLALLLLGSVRGEAGRIWLLFAPFACALAGAALAPAGRAAGRGALAAQGLLALALAASMVFVS